MYNIQSHRFQKLDEILQDETAAATLALSLSVRRCVKPYIYIFDCMASCLSLFKVSMVFVVDGYGGLTCQALLVERFDISTSCVDLLQ